MMRNALSKSSLSAGSKNRLKQFRSNLMRDYDKRNFDSACADEIIKFLRPGWKQEFRRTERYLRNLRSTKDGKLFSQGVKEYSKLLEAGKRFAEPNHTYFGWNENYKTQMSIMKDEFSGLRLDPLRYCSDDDIIRALPKLDTHAGFTYILSGIKEKGGNMEDIFNRFEAEVDDAIKRGTFGKPILPAVRTQGNGHAFDDDGNFTNDCDHKTRLVSMVDLMVIIAELIYARPIQDYMARANWYAGGKDLDHGVSRIISTMREYYPYWVSLDYSAYDQSVSAWLIHDAFEIIKCAFVGLTEREEHIFNLIEHDFITKDFIFGKEIIHSVKGVPSGSMFTQIIDSIVNVLVIRTYLASVSTKGEMIVMGDDNLVYTQDKLDVAELSSYLKKNFGMTVNPDKTCCGGTFDHPSFLSCEWRPEGRYREPHVVISKLLYPERERKYEGDSNPGEVLWAYYLTYPLAMEEIISVEKFLGAYPQYRLANLKRMRSHHLPGFLKYVSQYTRGYWAS